MWLMLQHSQPGDFVIATGESYSVRQFLEIAFSHVHLNWQDHVEVDPQYFRPTEVDFLQGDPTKSRQAFGWQPKTSFHQLVQMMVDADLQLAESESLRQIPKPKIPLPLPDRPFSKCKTHQTTTSGPRPAAWCRRASVELRIGPFHRRCSKAGSTNVYSC